ncbi:MAG: precorrin-6Y C5,15-methyltransferase (decarboxylating) subunit CbiT [Chloroflexi bacterium]|nr:precorrin-6Y C5,15-methyltransferase (decarboxylating) subunit CbiT [Chloroflexota bacterium]MDP6498623.1 precorrin-6Y C5,15-methyltransferase (decarboxylating) subunit CbiT [Dehalococcoidia bacterium]MQG11003.1 precorrin-6Y C5,15-methyltransferase (decarboxylating) subunit CbiT [SAR202 cluster bacterium]MQG53882.1 precorrin-6Y C5,15-methyltransferase (decarboxylating) subunit CbiT [SAR202 cluster bacterium]
MVKDLSEIRRSLGLPDDAFEQRRPSKGQITKREVRAVSLYSMGLRADSVVWDIGAGTGSVSVESALIANRGQVFSIERDTDFLPLLEANVAQWGAENVHIVAGEAPGVLEDLPSPDSVFVGGSGGNLSEILEYTVTRLNPDGTIVVNLAVLERTSETYRQLTRLGLSADITQVAASRGKKMPDGAVRLESLNPVFIVSGRRGN